MEDWAEIRRLHRAEGLSIKAIVRRVEPRHSRRTSSWALCVSCGNTLSAGRSAARRALWDGPTVAQPIVGRAGSLTLAQSWRANGGHR